MLFLFGRREAGIWAGVLAFALWVLLPRPELLGAYDIGQVKIDRYARQEVFMAFLAAAGAVWPAGAGPRAGAGGPALLSGVALGLAIACKAPAVLTLPAILLGRAGDPGTVAAHSPPGGCRACARRR